MQRRDVLSECTRHSFYALLLLAVVPVAAQQSDDNRIDASVGPDERLERTFLLKNAINCPRDRYKFRLTSDSGFVSLPLETVELSKSASTEVRVLFDSSGVGPGTHPASIRVECINCGRCRTREKLLAVSMTVTDRVTAVEEIEDQTPAEIVRSPSLVIDDADPPARGENNPATPAPDVPTPPERRVTVPDLIGLGRGEAEALLGELGLVPAIDNPGVAAAESATVASHLPAANALIPMGTSISLVFAAADGFAFSGTWLPVMVLFVFVVFLIVFKPWASGAGMTATATIEVRSEVDPGTQRVWPDISERQRSEVRVRLRSDAGKQSILGELPKVGEGA